MAEGAEVKIKIEADSKPAVGAFARVTEAISAAKEKIGAFTKALGVVGFAIHGLKLAVDAIRILHAWMTKSKTEAENLRRQLEQSRYERGVARAVEEYKKLNSEIERTLRLEKERAAIANRRTARTRDEEDARAELAKQREIAGLDPAADGYAGRKKEIEDRYAREAAERTAARAREDAGRDTAGLRKELDAKERQIAGQTASRDADLKNAEEARREIAWRKGRRPWLDAMGPLGGKEREENEARIEELQKRAKASDERAKGKEDDIRAARDAAETIRQAIDAAGGGEAAKNRAEAAKTAIDQGARERAAEEARTAREKEKKDEETRRETAKQREIAEIEIDDPRYEEKVKAVERKYAYQAAEAEEDDATREAGRLTVDNEIRAEAAAEARAAREKEQDARIGELDGFAGRLAATEDVSVNRLTAIGLGSGVEARAGIAGDVKKIVDLLKEEIQATKDNKPYHSDGVATVGE